MLVNLARTVFLYIIVITTMRVLGKKQVGQLETAEFVIVVLLSELAAVPMQDVDIPLMNSVIPIATLLCLEIGLSVCAMKVKWIRDILQGKPVIIVKQGKMDITGLKATRYNIDEVMEEIRQGGYSDIRDIEYAILENSGKVSIIPAARNKTVTVDDLKIKTKPGAFPHVVINDGKIISDELTAAGLTVQQLQNQLNLQKIPSAEDVFFAVYDSLGEFYFQLKPKGGSI